MHLTAGCVFFMDAARTLNERIDNSKQIDVLVEFPFSPRNNDNSWDRKDRERAQAMRPIIFLTACD